MTDIDTLSSGKYISLTTFRRTGTPVSTPVWVTREGGHLYVITEAGSGKAKRLRNNPSVTVAPCDMRGSTTGDAVSGKAELLDADGTRKVAGLIRRRYGLMAMAFRASGAVRSVVSRVRRRPAVEQVGLRITLDVG